MTLEQLLALGLTEEIAKKVLEAYQTSIKDKYVPIERFNEINKAKNQLEETIKERDGQLADLKKVTGDKEQLKKQIETLQEENKTKDTKYKTEMAALRKETVIELRLKDEKAKNSKAVKALLDLEKVSIDGDNLIGLDEQLKTLKEKESYLFGTDTLSGREPNKDTDPVGDEYKNNPWDKEHFNLTEQGKVLKENPELAVKLKTAAK